MSETTILAEPVVSEANRDALKSPAIAAQKIKTSLKAAREEGREDPEKAYKLVRLGKLALIGGKPIDAEKWAQSVTSKIDDPAVPDTEKDKYRPVAADAHALLGIIEASRELEKDLPELTGMNSHFDQAKDHRVTKMFRETPLSELIAANQELVGDLELDEQYRKLILETAIKYKDLRTTVAASKDFTDRYSADPAAWAEFKKATIDHLNQDISIIINKPDITIDPEKAKEMFQEFTRFLQTWQSSGKIPSPDLENKGIITDRLVAYDAPSLNEVEQEQLFIMLADFIHNHKNFYPDDPNIANNNLKATTDYLLLFYRPLDSVRSSARFSPKPEPKTEPTPAQENQPSNSNWEKVLKLISFGRLPRGEKPLKKPEKEHVDWVNTLKDIPLDPKITKKNELPPPPPNQMGAITEELQRMAAGEKPGNNTPVSPAVGTTSTVPKEPVEV